MDASQALSLTPLRRGAVARIDGRPGRGIAVFHGLVWITQYKDARDLFLGAGESFDFDRRGPVVVQAFTDAALLLYDSAADRAGDGLVAGSRTESGMRPAGGGRIGMPAAAAGCN
jgi:hypothetical protein